MAQWPKSWSWDEIKVSPLGLFGLLSTTLWLCQNSENGPVEIVDLPTKNRWFSTAFCTFTRGYIPYSMIFFHIADIPSISPIIFHEIPWNPHEIPWNHHWTITMFHNPHDFLQASFPSVNRRWIPSLYDSGSTWLRHGHGIHGIVSARGDVYPVRDEKFGLHQKNFGIFMTWGWVKTLVPSEPQNSW